MSTLVSITKSAMEARARRAAKRIGLRAIKSRRHDPLNNYGEFMLLDDRIPILGFRYDASPKEVIDYCK